MSATIARSISCRAHCVSCTISTPHPHICGSELGMVRLLLLPQVPKCQSQHMSTSSCAQVCSQRAAINELQPAMACSLQWGCITYQAHGSVKTLPSRPNLDTEVCICGAIPNITGCNHVDARTNACSCTASNVEIKQATSTTRLPSRSSMFAHAALTLDCCNHRPSAFLKSCQ